MISFSLHTLQGAAPDISEANKTIEKFINCGEWVTKKEKKKRECFIFFKKEVSEMVRIALIWLRVFNSGYTFKSQLWFYIPQKAKGTWYSFSLFPNTFFFMTEQKVLTRANSGEICLRRKRWSCQEIRERATKEKMAYKMGSRI